MIQRDLISNVIPVDTGMLIPVIDAGIIFIDDYITTEDGIFLTTENAEQIITE